VDTNETQFDTPRDEREEEAYRKEMVLLLAEKKRMALKKAMKASLGDGIKKMKKIQEAQKQNLDGIKTLLGERGRVVGMARWERRLKGKKKKKKGKDGVVVEEEGGEGQEGVKGGEVVEEEEGEWVNPDVEGLIEGLDEQREEEEVVEDVRRAGEWWREEGYDDHGDRWDGCGSPSSRQERERYGGEDKVLLLLEVDSDLAEVLRKADETKDKARELLSRTIVEPTTSTATCSTTTTTTTTTTTATTTTSTTTDAAAVATSSIVVTAASSSAAGTSWKNIPK